MPYPTLAAALLLALPFPLLAFDFSPRVMSTPFTDGQELKTPYFESKGTFYGLFGVSLAQTRITGNAQQATFTFDTLGGATLRLQSTPVAVGDAGPDERTRAMIDEAVRSVAPSGATVVSTESDFCPDFSNEQLIAYQVSSVYQLADQKVHQFIIFVTPLPQEPMMITITAFEENATEARNASVAIVRTLRPTTERELRTPAGM